VLARDHLEKVLAWFVGGFYRSGFSKVFYSHRRERPVEYVRSPGIRGQPDNNLIERFHGTIEDRTNPIRGFKAEYSFGAVLDGFVVHYNLLRAIWP